ncbi:hypothetical protein LXA43DRAFT_422413 [Ganoderma leucocontextum]|nr:hypothetical protein LXA43DRAFT_422413 [Ganoderma leucocontextum]
MNGEPSRKCTRNGDLEDDNSTGPTTGFDKVAAATRDSDYWFDDGNLILVSQGVAFRIYKGLLAEHSAMFRSMFHIAQAAPATEDLVDGCPVIPLDDSPNDLRELFRLIFPLSTNLKFNGRKVDIAFISAVIRLDHKYELKGLHKKALNYLTTYYTTSFDAWVDGRHAAYWQPDPIHAICAISLARLTNTPSILPAAFYVCAALGPDLVRGLSLEAGDGFAERLAPEDMRLCLEMKAHLVAENTRAAFLLFRFPGTQICQRTYGQGTCAEVWRRMLEQAGVYRVPHPIASERVMDSWVGNADCLPTTMLTVGPTPGSVVHMPSYTQRTLCKGCRNHLQVRDQEVRRQIWRRLPEFVGLTIENWDV